MTLSEQHSDTEHKPDITLSEQHSVTEHKLLALKLATHDPEQKQKLGEQIEEIGKIIQELVAKNIETATPEYAAITKELEKASSATEDAIKDQAKTADTIKKIAKVIQILVKVAASL